MNIGVIGYGYWGPNLVKNLAKVPNTKINIIADKNPSALALAKSVYPNVSLTTNPMDVLSNISVDAVVIATPISTHYSLTKQALLNHKHVLVEKPMTTDLDEAFDLVELALSNGKVLMVNHTDLYNPAIHKIKKLIDQGELGELTTFDAVRANLGLFQSDVNVLWDLGLHDLAILNYLIEERPTSVVSTGHSHLENDIENIGYLTLKYQSNKVAHISSSWVSPVKMRHITIGGTEKMIYYNDLDESAKIKLYDSGFRVNPEGTNGNRIKYRRGAPSVIPYAQTEVLSLVAQDFIQSIEQNRKPLSNYKSAIEVITILCAVNQSLKDQGVEISL